jgi:tetratricopeptide (TPR) repeat protein
MMPGYDPETLREVDPDPAAAAERLIALRADVAGAADAVEELVARGDLVDLLRITGRLDEAIEAATQATDRARIAGTAPQQHMARLRLAQVRRWRAEYDESDQLFAELVSAAERYGPVIAAFTHQGAGENDFDQARFARAAGNFTIALEVRERFELPDDQVAMSRVALAAARARAGGAE